MICHYNTFRNVINDGIELCTIFNDALKKILANEEFEISAQKTTLKLFYQFVERYESICPLSKNLIYKGNNLEY